MTKYRSFQAFATAYRAQYDAATCQQVENVYHRLRGEGATEESANEQAEAFRELRARVREEQMEIARQWHDPSAPVH